MLVNGNMAIEGIDPDQVAEALLTSAGWARIGLTAPSRYLREQAARELAITICEHLSCAGSEDADQFALPI